MTDRLTLPAPSRAASHPERKAAERIAIEIYDAIAQVESQRPYSCRLYDDKQRKCAFGSCDARTVERLKHECLRDGGRL
jgi:hypothetical protein